MKKNVLFFIATLMMSHSFAQMSYYAAAKAGLSLREAPEVNATVLNKIPYGENIQTINDSAAQQFISTEGFNGYWWKVSYKGKTGYVVSSYLLPWAPPKTGTNNLKDYFLQVSTVAGPPVIIKTVIPGSDEEMSQQLQKQLYKNGAEWHETEGYEYMAASWFLPDFTIEQAYLLLRLSGQYKEQVGEKDVFPVKNFVIKNQIGQKAIIVEREDWGNGKQGPINKIKIEQEQGAITTLEIFMLDNQVVIYWSSGV